VQSGRGAALARVPAGLGEQPRRRDPAGVRERVDPCHGIEFRPAARDLPGGTQNRRDRNAFAHGDIAGIEPTGPDQQTRERPETCRREHLDWIMVGVYRLHVPDDCGGPAGDCGSGREDQRRRSGPEFVRVRSSGVDVDVAEDPAVGTGAQLRARDETGRDRFGAAKWSVVEAGDRRGSRRHSDSVEGPAQTLKSSY
jgi:hypothetical protein